MSTVYLWMRHHRGWAVVTTPLITINGAGVIVYYVVHPMIFG